MDARKEGVAMIVVSVCLMVLALVLSSGYHPQAGLLYGLQHNMTLIDYTHCSGRVSEVMGGSICENEFKLVIKTKYFLAGLLLAATYGTLLTLGVVPSIKGFINKEMQ
tara:strand:- start:1733 stop:2056 length:324 start_codon:yes stop_codon:yes gene_type:complete